MTGTNPEKTEDLKNYLDNTGNSAEIDFNYILRLIDEGADPDTFDSKHHWSPLLLSLYEETTGPLEALLARNANPDCTDEIDRTALHHAATSGLAGAARMLIDKHADIDAQDQHGWTPLHTAINHRRLSAMQTLLAHGADPEAKTGLGDTPMLLSEDLDYPEARTLLHESFSMRHSNRLRSLHRRARKKYPAL